MPIWLAVLHLWALLLAPYKKPWNSPYAGVLHFRLQRTDLVSVVLDWLILRQ